jgi:hypothetical protein
MRPLRRPAPNDPHATSTTPSRLWPCFVVLATLSLTLTNPVAAQWQNIAPGIDYQPFAAPGPNNVFVARMDRNQPDVTLDTMLGQDRLLFGGTETVSSMATSREDTLSYWGEQWGDRYDVVAAINGDFYTGGTPVSGQIQGGWYAKRFEDFTGGSGFAWQLDRDAFIGGCVRHRNNRQFVSYPATGQTQNINGINRSRGGDELILYTHHWNFNTATDATGAEVLVKMNRPTLILPTPANASGTVVGIFNTTGATVIPFDHVVLSATRSNASKLLANVALGDEIQISQEITHYEHDCSTPRPFDWTKTYASIGGSFHFLVDGVVQSFSSLGAIQRHPRTAIAFNDDYVFFVVVDGRSGSSVGMSMTELGTFCLNTLGATEGINQDGGGSSTLWIDGQVVNVPSDGTERPVANGVFMAVVKPRAQTVRYVPDQPIRTSASVFARTGPGDNFATHTTIPVASTGTILTDNLAGVRATNKNWWRCDFDGAVGWLPQSALLELACAGDFNTSGDVEAGDLDQLAFCLTGPDNLLAPTHLCRAGDADFDRDIDLADIRTFQTCFTAP